MEAFEGVYDFTHPCGSFEVHLRPGGKFFAPKFQTKSSWMLSGNALGVDFGKYGARTARTRARARAAP